MTMMKAVRMHTFGGPEVLKRESVPVPTLEANEVLIRVAYAGVNMVDSYYRRGWYKPHGFPYTPGLEAAGTVIATGCMVEHLSIGQRVVTLMAQGTYAEVVAVPSASVIGLPPDIDFLTAATNALQALTALTLATQTFPISRGATVLVISAASSVGSHLCTLASKGGARVIGAVSTAQKAAKAYQSGCLEVVDCEKDDLVQMVNRLTRGERVDAVYDFNGGANFLNTLKCVKARGMVILCGQSSGPPPFIDPQLLRTHGSLYLTRPSLSDYLSPLDVYRNQMDLIWAHFRRGVLTPQCHNVFPLDSAMIAHQRLEDRSRMSKVLLEC